MRESQGVEAAEELEELSDEDDPPFEESLELLQPVGSKLHVLFC